MSHIAFLSSSARTKNTRSTAGHGFGHQSTVAFFANPKMVARMGLMGFIGFIACVSIYDTYLVALFRETILIDERNPICEMLIRKDEHSLSWFIAGKCLGNLFVIGSLFLLYRFKYKHVLKVAGAVAKFQFMLLMFLWYSDQKTGVLHFDGLFSHDPEVYAQGVISMLIHLAVVIGLIGCVAMIRHKWRSKEMASRLCSA